jgi:hypothetical protein
MLQISNLHATAANTPPAKGRLLLAALAAGLLTACGDVSVDEVKDKAAQAKQLIDPAALTEKLPPEARAVVTSYKNDLKAAASAHLAEYGQLPANLADLTSVAGARETAINLLADTIGEQVPFASRETLEKAASGVIATAERQILEQISVPNAPNK